MAVPGGGGFSELDLLTPQELYDLAVALLIDNNIMYITPAVMRRVILPIIVSYAGRGANISGLAPISWNPFTGQISIQQASSTQDGYISKEDFAAFAAAGNAPLQPLELRVLRKAEGNTGGFTIEVGDLVYGEPVSGVFWNQATYNGGSGGAANVNNYTVWSETSTA